MTIFIEDTFDAAHFLPSVPVGHKCKNMHGHTYKLRLEVTGDLDPNLSWVIDYADIKAIWEPLKDQVDHKLLNDIPGLKNPTCERLATWLWEHIKPRIPGLSKIELRETAACGVVYEGLRETSNSSVIAHQLVATSEVKPMR